MSRWGGRGRVAVLGMVTLGAGLAAASCSSSSDSTPAPSFTRQELLDPASCKACHVEHYTQWSGSMHAYASDDPVFRAMNARGQRLTGGQLGDFCVKCHAPMAVHENATKDGLNLDSVPASLKGVTCFFCHTADSVQDAHNADLTLADDLTLRGPYSDPVPNTAHRAGYAPTQDGQRLESGDVCGTCHDIETGHGANIERTYKEWKTSIFSHAPVGDTCAQCHMHQSTHDEPIAQFPGVGNRRTHDHTLAAVDVALTAFPSPDPSGQAAAQKAAVVDLLAMSLQSALCVSNAGGASFRVILDNVGAGHGVPSGALQDRRMWMELMAYEGTSTEPFYESGAVPDGVATTKSPDPDMWLLRDCLFDTSGNETHNFWEAADYDTNALPAKTTIDPSDPKFYVTHVIRDFPLAGAVLAGHTVSRATLRIRMRPMDFDVLQDLVDSKDLDPSALAAIPTYDLASVTWTPDTAKGIYVDGRQSFQCVTPNGLNLASQANPAPVHVQPNCLPR